MEFKIERFFSKKGFVYKDDTNNIIVNANYTLGLLLRKVFITDCSGNYIYVFKQENFFQKAMLNLVRFVYRPTTIPVYILYNNNNKLIGYTEKWKENGLFINLYGSRMKVIKENLELKDYYILKIFCNDEIIVKITKKKVRYGKKNLYNVYCESWKYDKNLLALVVALCDVIFFPEWFRWSAIEYDLR